MAERSPAADTLIHISSEWGFYAPGSVSIVLTPLLGPSRHARAEEASAGKNASDVRRPERKCLFIYSFVWTLMHVGIQMCLPQHPAVTPPPLTLVIVARRGS